jgi:hypothetical protein
MTEIEKYPKDFQDFLPSFQPRMIAGITFSNCDGLLDTVVLNAVAVNIGLRRIN